MVETERSIPSRANQRRKPLAAFSEVHRLRSHQHAHARRDCDHDAAVVTARKTSCKVASSLPGGMRTVAAPITISMTDEQATWLCTSGVAPARGRELSKTTGANAIRLSPARACWA